MIKGNEERRDRNNMGQNNGTHQKILIGEKEFI